MGRKTGLTDKLIQNLKPREKPYDTFDGDGSGVCIRVSPGGTKTFFAYIRDKGGRQHCAKLGRYPTTTLAEAREEARRQRKQIESVATPMSRARAAKSARVESHRIEDVVDNFVKRYCAVKNKPRTAEETERLLRKDFVARWSGWDMREITRAHVNEAVDAIVERSAPIGASRGLAAVRKLFNWYVDEYEGAPETSPCDRVRARAKAEQRKRVLSDAELKAIWLGSNQVLYPWGPMLRLLMLTGQRRAEVGHIRWTEIDLQQAVWVIPGARTKNRRDHLVPLSTAAVEILRGMPRTDSDIVLTTRVGTLMTGFSDAKEAIDHGVIQLGPAVADWRFHDLRRTMTTRMAQMGVRREVLKKVLNHVSGNHKGDDVTDIYNLYDYLAEKRTAMDAWAEHIGRVVGGFAAAARSTELSEVRG